MVVKKGRTLTDFLFRDVEFDMLTVSELDISSANVERRKMCFESDEISLLVKIKADYFTVGESGAKRSDCQAAQL
jgi:hypothetical protein